MEVGEDCLEIVDCFHYFGDVISCGVGVESAVSVWRKWRELARGKSEGLLWVCEDCIVVCCRNLGTNGKTGRIAS